MTSENTHFNVFIESGREHFSSNRAVDRFKTDIRTNDIDTLNHSSYLKEGYTFNVVKKENNIMVNVISLEEQVKEQKRKELRQRLRGAQYNRSGEAHKELDTIKRSVPDKLYKSYLNLLRNAGGSMPNIPPPNEVINNLDKYKAQISAVMGTMGSVSNNNNISNSIKHYFNSLGNMLGIEPMTNNIQQQNNDMEEEPPTLV
jgi:hypothetical protein